MVKCFEELKRQVPKDAHHWFIDNQPAETELGMGCEKLSKERIRKAIKLSKHVEVSGSDGIPAEAIKANLNIEILHTQIRQEILF